MSGHEHDAADMAVDVADEKKKEASHGHTHSHEHAEGHAEIVSLGVVKVGGADFMIDREGQVEAGLETEFGVERVGGADVAPSSAWIANPDGKKLCEPVEGEGHMSHWHFKVTPLYPVKKSAFILKVGEEEAVVNWHKGFKPLNGGLMAVTSFGFLELKLHGDAGDLELWLYQGKMDVRNKPKPFDVPKDTVVTLTFPTHENKTITLAVRNGEENEDEEGVANMRDDKTNYFIFPGESGQDPEWLVGETVTSWRGHVKADFEAGGTKYTCDPFVLVPHDAL